MAGPDFYKKDAEKATELKTRLTEIERELGAAYVRWEALEVTEAVSE